MPEQLAKTIRQAHTEDAQRCGDIAALAWQRVFDAWLELINPELFAQNYDGWREPKRQEVVGHIGQNPNRAIVTEAEGAVAGFFAFCLPGPQGVGEIGNNAVHPDFQGHGIGAGQCKQVLGIFREMGLTSATLYTGLDEGHAPMGPCT